MGQSLGDVINHMGVRLRGWNNPLELIDRDRESRNSRTTSTATGAERLYRGICWVSVGLAKQDVHR